MYHYILIIFLKIIIIVSYSVAHIYMSAKITYLSAGKQDVYIYHGKKHRYSMHTDLAFLTRCFLQVTHFKYI